MRSWVVARSVLFEVEVTFCVFGCCGWGGAYGELYVYVLLCCVFMLARALPILTFLKTTFRIGQGRGAH